MQKKEKRKGQASKQTMTNHFKYFFFKNTTNSHYEFGEVIHELSIEEVGFLKKMLLEFLVDGL